MDRNDIPRAQCTQATQYPHLEKINGAYFIASAIVSSTAPELYVNYYRVTAVRSDPYRPRPALDESVGLPVHYQGAGSYTYTLTVSNWARCYLVIDGKAPAEYIDDYALPCPKVRASTQTRWNGMHGRWEKYSTRKGWIPA